VWTTPEEKEKNLPSDLKRNLSKKDVEFYVIDATKIAKESGLGHRTNSVMQACF
jgi:pyruvate-ferredoxin/flavodoxin oxidoreductase